MSLHLFCSNLPLCIIFEKEIQEALEETPRAFNVINVIIVIHLVVVGWLALPLCLSNIE